MNPALDSRARFEAWAKTQPGYKRWQTSRLDGDYSARATQFAWEAWQAAIASMAAPEGWQLVPPTPTEEMHIAAVRTIVRCNGNDEFPGRVWRAMLAATPTPPIAALAAKEKT